MSDFGIAVVYVLANEGGYTNDPADHGGATKYGIMEAEARRHGYHGDMSDLPLDLAKSIYREDYWRFDGIADQRVATKLLDMAVSMGLMTTVRLAQQIVGTDPDGIFGPATVAAINSHVSMLPALVAASVHRYARIVANDHSQINFLVGWMDRAVKEPAP